MKARLFRSIAALLLLCLPAAAALHTEAWDDHSRAFHASPDRCPISTDHQCVACSIARLCAPTAAAIALAPPRVSERLREHFAARVVENPEYSLRFGRAPPPSRTS